MPIPYIMLIVLRNGLHIMPIVTIKTKGEVAKRNIRMIAFKIKLKSLLTGCKML